MTTLYACAKLSTTVRVNVELWFNNLPTFEELRTEMTNVFTYESRVAVGAHNAFAVESIMIYDISLAQWVAFEPASQLHQYDQLYVIGVGIPRRAVLRAGDNKLPPRKVSGYYSNPGPKDHVLSRFSGCTFRTNDIDALQRTYLEQPSHLRSMFLDLAKATRKPTFTSPTPYGLATPEEPPGRKAITFIFTDDPSSVVNTEIDSGNPLRPTFTLWASLDYDIVIVRGVKHFFANGKEYPAVFTELGHPRGFTNNDRFHWSCIFFCLINDREITSNYRVDMIAEALLMTTLVNDLEERVDLIRYFQSSSSMEAVMRFREKLRWDPAESMKWTAGVVAKLTALQVVEEFFPGKRTYTTEFVLEEVLPSCERLAAEVWRFPPPGHDARHYLHDDIMKQVTNNKRIGKAPYEKLQFAHAIGDYRTLVSLASQPDVHCHCETLYRLFEEGGIPCYGDLYDFLVSILPDEKEVAADRLAEFQLPARKLVLEALEHAAPAKMRSSVSFLDGSMSWFDWNRASVPFWRNFAYTLLLVMLIILHTTIFARGFPSVVPGYAEESITDCLAKNSTYNYLDDYTSLFRHLKEGTFTVCPEWPGFTLTGATLLHRSAINASKTQVKFYNRKDLPLDIGSSDNYVHALQFKWESDYRNVEGSEETYYGATHVVLSWTPEPYHSDVANITRRRQVMDMHFVHRIVPKSSIVVRKYAWLWVQIVLCLFAGVASIWTRVYQWYWRKQSIIRRDPTSWVLFGVWLLLEVITLGSIIVIIEVHWSIPEGGDWSDYERWTQLVQFSRIATLISVLPGMRFLTVSPTISTLVATLKVCAAVLLTLSLIVVFIAKPYESTGWFEGITLSFLTRFFLSAALLVVGSVVASFRSQPYTIEDINYQYNEVLDAHNLFRRNRANPNDPMLKDVHNIEYSLLRWKLSSFYKYKHHFLPIISIVLLVGASIISVVVPPADLKAPLGAREGTSQSQFSLQGLF